MKSKLLSLLFSIGLTSATAVEPLPTATKDGSQFSPDELTNKWKVQPTTMPPGIRTRGFSPGGTASPNTRTRGLGMSQNASAANHATLENLRIRGVKTMFGQEAVAAQQAQDQKSSPATSTSLQNAPEASIPEPVAFIQVPLQTEKQVAFKLEFELNSTELANESSKAELNKIATVMRDLPDSLFLLEGHTCDHGTDNHNQILSEARALKIRSLLADLGVGSERLLAVGRGETEPQVQNQDEASRAQNRRVVIGPIELNQR